MSLPALRLPYLRAWQGFGDVALRLRGALLGQVLPIPSVLGPAERDELADLLALLLELPLAFAGPFAPGHLYLLPGHAGREPPPVAGSLVVFERPVPMGARLLEAPQALMVLRDAVCELIGRRFSGGRLAALPAWLSRCTDTPGTAIHFADGVLAALAEAAGAPIDDGALVAAGLGACLGWLCRGADPRVIEWLVAWALGTPSPGREVERAAALLGEEAALTASFRAGLLEVRPERAGEPPDLRRTLSVLGELEALPGRPSPAQLLPHLSPELRRSFERLRPGPRRPLGLSGPVAPVPFVGREETLVRLQALFEPAATIQTVVLAGPPGIGKTSIAARLAEILALAREPVWLDFTGSPELAWRPVAHALGVDASAPAASGAALPPWLAPLFSRLATGSYLIVVDHVDDLGEERLPDWLPCGPGALAVLVCSRRTQRPLVRLHDAIVIAVGPMPREEARLLLSAQARGEAERILGGEADGVIEAAGGLPLELALVAHQVEQLGVQGVAQRAAPPPGGLETEAVATAARLDDLLEGFLDSLGAPERDLVDALSVCSFGGASLPLLFDIAAVAPSAGEAVVDRLIEAHALARLPSGRVRLQDALRRHLEQRAPAPGLEALIERHALAVRDRLTAANADAERVPGEDLVQDGLLALSRAAARAADRGEPAWLALATDLARELVDVRQGVSAPVAEQVAAALRVASVPALRTAAPRQWALAQIPFAAALTALAEGGAGSRLDEAVTQLRAALALLDRAAEPVPWAEAQWALASALANLDGRDPQEALDQAVSALQAALEVLGREGHPERWALGLCNLAQLEIKREPFAGPAALERAIDHARGALDVLTPDRPAWDLAQLTLGEALLGRFARAGEPPANAATWLDLEAAIEALQAVPPSRSPLDWAEAQSLLCVALGLAARRTPPGQGSTSPAALGAAAVAAGRRALLVLSRERYPLQFARAQSRLGAALAALPGGDRAENLAQAIAAYQASLAVDWRAREPRAWRDTLASLQAASEELASLRRSGAAPSGRDQPG